MKKIIFEKNKMTSHFREFPDFIVTGNTFCGKTLLYNYLAQNKFVIENLKEETAFFNVYYDKGPNWYKANFPTSSVKKSLEKKYGCYPLVGETINLPYKEIPERIFQLMPNAKIIVVLRNPIERAYASHKWLKDAGIESYSFEDAIQNKVDRRSKLKHPLTENKIEGLENSISSYLLRSIYYYDIKRWREFFPTQNMIFIRTEDIFENTLSTVNNVFEFLGLEKIDKINIKKYDSEKISISKEFRNELNEFFLPFNKKLYNDIQKNFDWN